MISLPFQPLRDALYRPQELLAGFDPDRAASLEHVPDLHVYQYFVRHGRSESHRQAVAVMQALHDSSMTVQLRAYLKAHPRRFAIMGGHKLTRGSPEYRTVATLARRLSQAAPSLLISGGGPGAMEATHLGARFGPRSDAEFLAAIDELSHAAATLPPALNDLVNESSHFEFNPQILAALHQWWAPAWRIAERTTNSGPVGESLAIPTWHYGHEPFSPLATDVAKYFQNSIREDGLLAIANSGVIFFRGAAGTIQEIFQDACQNYYRTVRDESGNGIFSPMILFGKKQWIDDYPAYPLLQSLFKDDKDFAKRVKVVDTVDEAVAALL